MLVLSRKCGETIVIADNIEVTVLEVQGNRVKLGVVADPHIAIHRGELHEKIMRSLSSNALNGAHAELAYS